MSRLIKLLTWNSFFAVVFMPILLLEFLKIWNFSCLRVHMIWSITVTSSKLRTLSCSFKSLWSWSAIWKYIICFGVHFFASLWIFSKELPSPPRIKQLLRAQAEMDNRLCFRSGLKLGVSQITAAVSIFSGMGTMYWSDGCCSRRNRF